LRIGRRAAGILALALLLGGFALSAVSLLGTFRFFTQPANATTSTIAIRNVADDQDISYIQSASPGSSA
jgi:hypothetical protein